MFQPRLYFFCIFFNLILLKFNAFQLNFNYSSYIYAIEFFSKTSFNGSIFSNIHFFWANLLYLAIFFWFLFFLLNIFSPNTQGFSHALFLPILFFFYTIGICDFLILNNAPRLSNHLNVSVNIFLTNLLNKYHPLLFFISAILFLYLNRLKLIFPKLNIIFLLPLKIKYFYNQRVRILLLNCTTLLMGSWWALQEGTWGGWWNWDPSETFGFEVTLFILLLSHSTLVIGSFKNYMKKYDLLFLIFLFSYFFLQLNFELVSHNFGLKFFFFFNNNLFSLLAILSLSFLKLFLLSFSRRGFWLVGFSRVKVYKNNFLLEKIFLYTSSVSIISVCFLLFYSFCTILDYFPWNPSRGTYFNNNLTPSLLILFFSAPLLLSFNSISKFQIFLPSLILFVQLNFFLPLLFFNSKGFLASSHNLLSWVFITTIIFYKKFFLNWTFLSYPQSFSLNGFTLRERGWIYLNGEGLLEKTSFWADLNNFFITAWTTSINLNGEEINNFLLYFSHKMLSNFYYLSEAPTLSSLQMELQNLPSLFFLVVLMFFFFTGRENTKNKNNYTRIFKIKFF